MQDTQNRKPKLLKDLPNLKTIPARFKLPNGNAKRTKGREGKTVSSADGMLRIPPRVLDALQFMAYDKMRRPAAANAAGLADVTFRRYLRNPMVIKEWRALCQDVASGEWAASIGALADVRDSPDAPYNAKVNASKALIAAANPEPSKAPSINFNGAVSIRAGFIMDVSEHKAAALQIMQQAGSSKNIIEGQALKTVVHGDSVPSKTD